MTREGRRGRVDGDMKRQEIIEAAGRVFAREGYKGTVARVICKQAHTNNASINYYFGSRDGLYSAVITEARERLTSLQCIPSLLGSTDDAETKLASFVQHLSDDVLSAGGWPVQVFIRELLSPSPMMGTSVLMECRAAFDALSEVLSDLIGMSTSRSTVAHMVLTVVSPLLFMSIMSRDDLWRLEPLFTSGSSALASVSCTLAMHGLTGRETAALTGNQALPKTLPSGARGSGL